MRVTSFYMIAIFGFLAGCAATAATYEPIPGSITYGGQPRTKLMKSPIGSTFEHRFQDPMGHEYVERYRIRPDRSLEIVSRVRVDLRLGLNRHR